MAVNNFNRVNYYLDFKEDHFYYIQILSRKKDNPKQKHVKLIRNFYVDDSDYFWKLQDTIVDLCEFFNARAYIRLNIRSYRQTALEDLKLLADYVRSRQYKAARSAFSKASGRYNAQENTLWVVDMDNEQRELLNDIKAKINALQRDIQKDYNCYGTLPTPNGMHLISNPFNLQDFKNEFPEIDVKKDNPTILYAPDFK